jgi:serine phosphatase RsbU (regulator of sigma subunit)
VPQGMFRSTDFSVCHLQLAAGDKLFLYTHGLSEVFDAGDEFGIGRVHSLASRHGVQHPDEMPASCLSEIRSFSAASRQTDDLTPGGPSIPAVPLVILFPSPLCPYRAAGSFSAD